MLFCLLKLLLFECSRSRRRRRILRVPIMQQRRRQLRKCHFKNEYALLQTLLRSLDLVQFVKCCQFLGYIELQGKKRKVAFLCSRPRQHVKLVIFTSQSCSDGKKIHKKGLLIRQSKPIGFLTFSLTSPSSLL